MTEESTEHVPSPGAAGIPGTPQAAAAEALKIPMPQPEELDFFDLDQIKVGEEIRCNGINFAMPNQYGGGFMRIRPMAVTPVTIARDQHLRWIKVQPSVKAKIDRKTGDLPAKAAQELNRFTVVMCCVEWNPEKNPRIGGEVHDVSKLDEVGLRDFLTTHFMPRLDLDRIEVPAETEMVLQFFQHLLEGLDVITSEQAEAIAEVGKDYATGLSAAIDYSG